MINLLLTVGALVALSCAVNISMCEAEELYVELGQYDVCWNGYWRVSMVEFDYEITLPSAIVDSVRFHVSGDMPSGQRTCYWDDMSHSFTCNLFMRVKLSSTDDIAGDGTFAGIFVEPIGVYDVSPRVVGLEYDGWSGYIEVDIPPGSLTCIVNAVQSCTITIFNSTYTGIECTNCRSDIDCIPVNAGVTIYYNNHVANKPGTWGEIKSLYR